MKDQGRKRHLVNSASDDGREAHVKGKRPCEDLDLSFVENLSSAFATTGGTNADEVTALPIFKVLAGRKALKCPPREEKDLANSASATTSKMPLKRPLVNPAGLIVGELRYGGVRVGRTSEEMRYPEPLQRLDWDPDGVTVRRIASRQAGIIPTPKVPMEVLMDNPFYRAAVANGLEIEVKGNTWCTKPMFGI